MSKVTKDKVSPKVSLQGVDSLWGDCTFIQGQLVYSSRLGVIVVDLFYFALFEDF